MRFKSFLLILLLVGFSFGFAQQAAASPTPEALARLVDGLDVTLADLGGAYERHRNRG